MPGTAVGRHPSIRTPDQRVRVFVSSTLGELAEERAAVRAAIEQLRLTPVLFELGARPHPPAQLYRSYLEQSDVFVGIYGQRYGWIAPGEDRSGVEDEFERAAALPQLLYVREPAPDRDPRLEAMLDRLRDTGRASYRTFATSDELARLVQDDLMVLLTERFSVPRSAPSEDGPASSVVEVGAELAAARAATAPPVPLTPTVGREREIDDLAHLLTRDRCRLVTVTGPGGVGKSRLVLEVARRVDDGFPDGVHLVMLETLDDPRRLLRLVADQLGVAVEGLRPIAQRLVEHLRDRRLLLVLDNLEQLVASAPDIAGLLDRCPTVHVLATSRRPLRLRGEREFPLAPLPVPHERAEVERSPAVQLFVQRAGAVRPDLLAPDRDELVTIGELVHLLDGLPLAIELAAPRLRLLSTSELLQRLHGCLDLLTSGATDLPERQRNLRATLDWSYRQLAPHEQQVLDRLSVFSTPASIPAIEAVADRPGDILDTVGTLLEANLVRTTVIDGETRITMLHTVRAYAAEQLSASGTRATVADHHARWFLERARLSDPLRDPQAHRRVHRLLRESDDICAAMDWVLHRQDPDGVCEFAGATWIWFWQAGRLVDVAWWFEAAADLVRTSGPPSARAVLFHTLGQIREILGDAPGAVAVAEEALALGRELDMDLVMAGAHLVLSAALPHLDRVAESFDHASAALGIGERIGDAHVIGFASAMLGTWFAVDGRLDDARQAIDRMQEAAERVGFQTMVAQAQLMRAMVDTLGGGSDAVWPLLGTSAAGLHDTGNREILSYWFWVASLALQHEGRIDDAARCWRAAADVRDDLGVTLWPLLDGLEEQLEADLSIALPGALPPPSAAVGRDPWPVVREVLGDRDGVGPRAPVPSGDRT